MGIHGDRQKKMTPEQKETFNANFDRIFSKNVKDKSNNIQTGKGIGRDGRDSSNS